MIMPPRLRKFVLTAHVVSSVGWIGAVVTFIAISVIALSSQDGQTVRAALILMEPIGWYVLLPLAVTSLLTGTIQGLGSTWGLVRHYWVLFKLVIGAVSSYVLLMFNLTTVGPVTRGAADPATSIDELRALAGTPRDHALLALTGLLTATVLAVYKPRGLTRYGQRRQRGGQRVGPGSEPVPSGDRTGVAHDRRPTSGRGRWVKAAGFILGVLVWAVLVRVLLGTDASGGGHGPGANTPGVSREQQPNPGDGGGHTPPPGIPDHGGG